MPSVDAVSETEQTANARRRCRELLAKLAAVVGNDKPQTAAALARAQSIGDILAALTDDDDILGGALLLPLLEAHVLTLEQASGALGETPNRIATELQRLGSLNISMPIGGCAPEGKRGPERIPREIGAYAPEGKRGPERIPREIVGYAPEGKRGTPALSANQAEGLRKMLLAIVTDPRLVLVKLAAQLQQLRDSKDAPPAERERLAYETREVYAPLANRLGVWQLKWELEDLSFRYLDPENYKRVAGWLAAKRADRERYIGEVIELLRKELAKASITGEIAGRPKHIYSIWRKMQRKDLAFDQLYDIRAVRVLVGSVADCYAALGIVHGLWPYIPGEFDDYIATPKDNLYRSLHTAVIGPGKQPLEIQIRTREMHDHAELGVAAHWRYKEGGKSNPAYEQKIVWLRQILEPGERGEETEGEFLDRVRSEIFEDRVYAISPRGEVVDLPRGATPLDFAYHVHTDLGHRCRGAKVNGRMVPLNQTLTNGDQVEIITAKQPNPSRDWLVPSLGYLASPRNRNKVRSWFRKLDEQQNQQQGKQILERELHRLAIHSVTLPELISEFNFDNAEQLYRAIGEGEINVAQISGAIQRRAKPQELPTPVMRRPAAEPKKASGITIDGVDDLLSNFAGCCSPVPPEAIGGYITLGRGVTIHREDCANFKRLAKESPERVIPVEWGTGADRSFPVDIHVHAHDRRGLLRDISAVLADSKINIHAMNTVTREAEGIADMDFKITVHDLEELSRVLARIQGLPNILSARRKV